MPLNVLICVFHGVRPEKKIHLNINEMPHKNFRWPEFCLLICWVCVYFFPPMFCGGCSNRSKAVRGHALKGVCEIQAAAHAINLANQMGIYALTIFTASQFLVNAINAGWMLQWKQDNWQQNGRLVINHLDFKRLDVVLLKNAHMNIRFVHIPNNCGDPHIMAADQLAHEGAQKYQRIHSSTHY